MAFPSSLRPRNYSYNVFSSFHGPDVRKTLLSHIREQFDRNGITMFDDQKIVRSATITPSLTDAIKESRISIVILSKKYASSSWCLDELVKILECKEAMGQIVMTIFYGVDPSDVRKQTGEFGIHFNETCARRTDEDKQNWSKALKDVGNIAGEDFLRWDNEANMIKKIARDVLDKLNATPSRDFDGMVGLEAHLREMESLLDLDNVGVKIVAISGPAGIGKTTIARALHGLLSNRFQLSCFVDNLRGSYHSGFDEYGLKLNLQEQFLSKVLNQSGMRICHLGAIKEYLSDQRVLIILDDVNNLKQLEALANETTWFGPRSRIIVTTENKELLQQHGINNTYHVGFPHREEALKILCRYAFRQTSPRHGFKELVETVTELCGNLPLGLRVVGSSLRGKNEEEWEEVIRRLETIFDHEDIEEVLRVGYESLHENEQSLFLHIAVFFNYRCGDLMKTMFADSDMDVKYGLKILENRSLIEIEKSIFGDQILMHRLLQQVGKKAIHRQEPWKRQILIDAHEICDVLEDAKGTRAVSGISFDISNIDEVSISERAFKKMPNLRFLRVYKSRDDGDYRMHVPKEMEFSSRLRLLDWKAYPIKCLPPTFNPEYLVGLRMRGSQLEKLWEGIQVAMIDISFNYRGHYSHDGDDIEWNPREHRCYTIYMDRNWKQMSYSSLVGKICRKMKADESTHLKISYYQRRWVKPKMISYIEDDEDTVGYIMACKKDASISGLHVEVVEGVEENLDGSQLLREDEASRGQPSRPCVSFNELASDARVNEDGIVSHYTESEPLERVAELKIVPYSSAGENFNIGDGNHEDTRDVEGNQVVDVEWEDDIDMVVKQEFLSKREVQDLIDIAVHQNCFDYITNKSTPTLFVVKCRDKDCRWSVRAAKDKNSDRFSIRTYNKMHTCCRVTSSTSKKRKKGTPRLVASVIHQDYPGKFDTPSAKNLVDLVQSRLGVKLSYSTALRGKKLAVSDVRGSPADCYSLLPSYLHMLETVNPGTVTRLECDEDNKFKYLFFALGACIEGFKAMRKVIVIDGTHLKNVYGGVLFVATAQDPEHHHYPLAFGVGDGEKDASWRWFLQTLKTVVPDDPGHVIVSDRHQSIIKIVEEVYPNSKHGHCMWHLSQNILNKVHKVNKKSVAEQFMECAQAYSEAEFTVLFTAFKIRYPQAGRYLDNIQKNRLVLDKWARCYFPGERYNIMTTNACESMNSALKDARMYLLLPMLDAIVGKLSYWFNKHRKAAAEVPPTQKLVPSIAGLLHKRCKDAKKLKVSELNSFTLEYIVMGSDCKEYLVDLTRKTCSCKHFDIDRYPCEHAIVAASTHAETAADDVDLHVFCSPYYFMEQLMLAYYQTIYPVPHKSEWKVPEYVADMCVLPLDYEKKKGRNQEVRFPSVGERRRRTKTR